MSAFISPPPEEIEAFFDIPRDRRASGRGPSEYVFGGEYEWSGTMKFPPVDARDSRVSPLHGIARADRPDVGFFVDIPNPKLVLPATEAPPTWVTAGNGSNHLRITLQTGHGVTGGREISVRVEAFPQYVTARTIDFIDTNIDGADVAVLVRPLPLEFFPVVQTGDPLQYCVDRPHVRAVFSESPQGIRRSNTYISNIPAVKWREDTLGNVNGLRDVSGVAPGLENVILTNRGEPILTNLNAPIEVND